MQTVEIFISGDFCPARVQSDLLLYSNSTESVFGGFHELLQNVDLAITNLECPLTSSNSKIQKIGPNLKAYPGIAELLKSAEFDLLTLANNHIYDYGQEGLVDTLDVLKANDINYVGAGKTLAEAQQVFYHEIKGIKIAIVNFCEIEFSCANAEHGGANPMDLVDNVHQIQQAKEKADHVIVIVHGGHEQYYYPSPETLKRYRFLAEQNVSAVIGHHTHCIGGCEIWEGTPVFYSLGNFFFPYDRPMPDMWYEGYALQLTISKESLSYEILPYEQCRNQSLTITRNLEEVILQKIEVLSHVLSDDLQVVEHWKKFTEDKTRFYLTKLSGFGRYQIAILRRLGLLSYFYNKSQLNSIRQIITCEAHREAAYQVLSNYLKQAEKFYE